MNTDIYFEPETEAEREFMEQLAYARNRALDEGVTREDVSRVLSIYAQALLSDSFEQTTNDTQNDENPLCPECGSLIEGVEVRGIGELPTILPCGCDVEFNELPDSIRQNMLE